MSDSDKLDGIADLCDWARTVDGGGFVSVRAIDAIIFGLPA